MKALFLKLLGISKTIWEFIGPILISQTKDSLEKILPIAASIVAELALRNDLSGNQKAAIAKDQLSNVLVKEGITAGTSLINLALEMAVNKLKHE